MIVHANCCRVQALCEEIFTLQPMLGTQFSTPQHNFRRCDLCDTISLRDTKLQFPTQNWVWRHNFTFLSAILNYIN